MRLNADARTRHQDIEQRKRGFLRKLVQPKKLEAVFLFVTSQCNSKCRTCFYHSKLNDGRDLSFAEIETMARTAPRFDKLWLSGGEPTLRKDLVEIVRLFYDHNQIKVVNLPSNGLRCDRLERIVARLLDECPKLEVHLNLSLDGFDETHDAIRGVPGGFRKTLSSIERMKARFAGNGRLVRNVASVVTPENYDELFELGAYLLQQDLVGAHVFEVTRGDPLDPTTKSVSPAQMRALYDRVYPLFELQAERLFAEFGGAGRRIATTFFLGFMRFVQEIQGANIAGPCDWGMPCTAGETTLVVDHDGQFRSCEMRPPIGRLRDFDFDLTAAFESGAMQREIADVGGGYRANCWCTHGCWIMSSMKFSPKTLLLRLPAAYLRARKLHRDDFALPKIDLAPPAQPSAAADQRS